MGTLLVIKKKNKSYMKQLHTIFEGIFDISADKLGKEAERQSILDSEEFYIWKEAILTDNILREPTNINIDSNMNLVLGDKTSIYLAVKYPLNIPQIKSFDSNAHLIITPDNNGAMDFGPEFLSPFVKCRTMEVEAGNLHMHDIRVNCGIFRLNKCRNKRAIKAKIKNCKFDKTETFYIMSHRPGNSISIENCDFPNLKYITHEFVHGDPESAVIETMDMLIDTVQTSEGVVGGIKFSTAWWSNWYKKIKNIKFKQIDVVKTLGMGINSPKLKSIRCVFGYIDIIFEKRGSTWIPKYKS